ncbi:MAG TPA: phosphomannomutase [Polyangiaceae bacterium]|nr:phosphomannomutase [Polyangiaceae bacterium]
MAARVGIAELMESSGVKFGTSGARGLVSALTDRVAYSYCSAFLGYLERTSRLSPGSRVALGGDLRSSTERILRAAARAAADRGHQPVYAGRLPSPALMLYGMDQRIPSIMVTGSHIPDDRNGIKFNTAEGEITKADEEGIRRELVELPDVFGPDGNFRADTAFQLPPALAEPTRRYVARWLDAFPRTLLNGRRIAVYGHSAVGREVAVEILESLGAEVLRLGWSERFISVDTEAIRPEDVELALGWAKEHGFFALVSSDGDSDRPLIADESGRFIRGDVAGVLTARFLAATFVAAPVSCNTALERSGWFRTQRTRIGSPYVIEAMVEAARTGSAGVVGYEANGGFLSATELSVPGGGALSPLPTRDPVVVQLSILASAVRAKSSVSALLGELPQRFTQSDRLPEFPTELSRQKLKELSEGGPAAMQRAFPELGTLASVDEVDGLRMTFENGEVLHVRASGNAPELRCYVEADSEARASALLRYGLATLASFRG